MLLLLLLLLLVLLLLGMVELVELVVRVVREMVVRVVGGVHDRLSGDGFVLIAQVDEDGRVHRWRRADATTGEHALERLLFMMGHRGSLLDALMP